MAETGNQNPWNLIRLTPAEGVHVKPIRIDINGTPLETQARSLFDILQKYNLDANEHLAVAINNEVIPKSEHASRLIHDGDQIEILSPTVGG